MDLQPELINIVAALQRATFSRRLRWRRTPDVGLFRIILDSGGVIRIGQVEKSVVDEALQQEFMFPAYIIAVLDSEGAPVFADTAYLRDEFPALAELYDFVSRELRTSAVQSFIDEIDAQASNRPKK